MKVRACCKVNEGIRGHYEAGTEFELDDARARRLMELGMVEEASDTKAMEKAPANKSVRGRR